MERIASIFTNGGSQAVRLPKEFRFEGNAVRVHREGARIILEPMEKPAWPASFFERLAKGPLPDDFEVPTAPADSTYREQTISRLGEE